MQENPDPLYDHDEKPKNDNYADEKPKRKGRPRTRLRNTLVMLTLLFLASAGAGLLLVPRFLPTPALPSPFPLEASPLPSSLPETPTPGGATLVSELVHEVAWSPDGQQIAVASASALRVYPADLKDPRGTTLTSLNYETNELMYSPDGRWLAQADVTQVQVWDMRTGQLHHVFPAALNVANTIAFSPDSRQLAIATSSDATVQVWDVEKYSVISMPESTLALDQDFFQAVQYTQDGTRLIALANTSGRAQPIGKQIYAWATQGNPAPQLWQVGGEEPYGMVFSPDGRVLAYETFEQLVVWDYERRTVAAAPWPKPANYNFSRALSFAPGSQQLAFSLWTYGSTQNGRGLVRILDVMTNEVIEMQGEHIGHVSSAQFSPDGRLLVTGGWDGTVRLWDAASGALLTVLQI